MKKIITFLALVFSFNAYTQIPSIAISNFPILGDTDIMIIIDTTQAQTIVQGSAGANQTWAFNSLIKKDSDVTAMISPANSPYISNFASANLVAENLSYSPVIYQFLDIQTNSYAELGSESSNVKDVFSPAYQSYSLPFTYLNNYTTITNGVQTSNSTSILHFTVYDTITADAYGTINIQGNIYNNVIRLYQHRMIIDSLFLGSTFIQANTVYGASYFWYDQNYRNNIFRIDYGADAKNTIKQVSYSKSPKQISNSNGIIWFSNINNQINIYPNPTPTNFVIETNSTDKQTLQVFDVNGKLVLTQTINGKTNIDASNLVEGVYNLSLQNSSGVVNKCLVIVR